MSVHRTILVLSLVAAAVGSTARGSETTVRLKAALIPAPGAILSKSDVSTSSSRPIQLDKFGAVVPKRYAVLSKRPSYTMKIADVDYMLRREGATFVLQAPRTVPTKLVRRATGLQTVPLTFADRRRYILAFPVAGPYSVGCRSGSVQKGSVGGAQFALYDDNTDGYYTTDDTFQVGQSLVFAPISGYFTTVSAVYKLGAIDRTGSEVTCSRYSGETGQVSLRGTTRGIAVYAAFGSKETDLNLVLSTSDRRPAKVIPGKYEFLYGLAYGASKRKAYAGIVPGSLSPVEVGRTGIARAEMGGPYHLEFTHTVRGSKLALSPSTIRLKGKGGEEYVGFKWQGAPQVKLVSGGRTVSSKRMEFG